MILTLAFGASLAVGGDFKHDERVRYEVGKRCERSRLVRVSFSAETPNELMVRSSGPSCSQATIIVTVKDASRRTIWREETPLSLVITGERWRRGDPEMPFERVIAIVEHWASIEPLTDAPAWSSLVRKRRHERVSTGVTQYETRLTKLHYDALRNRKGRMLCIPTGPETAHCLTRDPLTRQLVELLVRGI